MNKNFKSFNINFGKQIVHEDINIDNVRTNQHYLHRLAMVKTLEWVNRYINRLSENKNDAMNNIYSIVGDRGTGKSSFLSTLEMILRDGKYLKSLDTHSGKLVYVMPRIDPTVFDSKINVLEFFVAYLNTELHKIRHNRNDIDNKYFLKLEKFSRKTNEIIEIIKNLQIENNKLAEDNEPVEFLDALEKKSEFKTKITDLLDLFLSLISTENKEYSYISLVIDDLDLIQHNGVYRFLNNMFSFLKDQKKLIIFLAYREEQLNNAVIDHLIQQNKYLLDNQIVNIDELQKQAINYIEKGLPRSQRVYLFINHGTTIYDVISPFLDGVAQKKSFEDYLIVRDDSKYEEKQAIEVTVNEFLKEEMMKQTRLAIDPIDAFEDTNFTFPKTLRSVIEFLELLQEMVPYDPSDSNFRQSIWDLRDNVKSYKYYLTSRLKDYLPVSDIQVISEWSSRDYGTKNSYICKELFKQLPVVDENDTAIFIDLEKITKKEVYNTSLGDVFTAITAFKKEYNNNEEKNFFIYGIKMLYSVELLLTLTKYTLTVINEQSDRNNKNSTAVKVNKQGLNPELKRYLSLARGKIIPDGFWYSEEWQSGVEYKVVGEKQQGPSDVIRKNLLYSGVSAFLNSRLNFLDYTQNNFSFKYRDIYEKDAEKFASIENRSTKKYNIDFFSKILDEAYISQTMEDMILKKVRYEEYKDMPYLFYSMFDLDFFMRKRYSRNPSNKIAEAEYIMRKINDIFIKNVKVTNEKDMKSKMVNPLFSISENRNFSPLFTNEDIDEISNQLSKINKSIDIGIFSGVTNELVNEYNKDNDYMPNIKDYRLFLREMKNNDLINNIEFSDEQINRIAETIRNGSRTAFSAVDNEIFVKICKYISNNIEDIKVVDEY